MGQNVFHAGGAGAGYGLTVESDWWRLLHGLRGLGGLGEVYTTCLALAAGASLDLEMTLTPVPPASGGYWHFINALRRRWGVNGLTMARPMFWHYARRPGVPAGVEQMRASLAFSQGQIFARTYQHLFCLEVAK